MSDGSISREVPDIENRGQLNIYYLLIGFLGLVGLVSTIGGIVLAALDKPMPDAIVALGATSIGALAGLLAPSPRS